MVAPVFFLMFFGIVEFGRLTMARNVMTQATSTGARRAILDGATNEEVTAVIEAQLASSGISDPVIEFTPSDLTTASSGDDVTIKISVEFSDISWLPLPSYFQDSTINTSTTMRREGF